MAVTCQSAGGNLGCLMMARLPMTKGPLSSRLILVTDAVHSCQRSTSLMTCQTRSGPAAVSPLMLNNRLSILTLPLYFDAIGPFQDSVYDGLTAVCHTLGEGSRGEWLHGSQALVRRLPKLVQVRSEGLLCPSPNSKSMLPPA